MSQLRDYQQDAVDAAKSWMKSSVEPCLIEAPTGSGKSHIVASLADWLHDISGGKRVLCLAPQKELTLQNAKKMIEAGHPCSIFSASAGIKSTRNNIVFATPKTVSNSISRFTRGDYCAIVIDEAHTIAPTVMDIITEMRAANPNLRIVGLSATPYKLGKGFIFRMWPGDGANCRVNNDDNCRDPFFVKMVYTIDARYLIDKGYLTRPIIGAINAGSYDTSGLVVRANGTFDAASVDVAFVGHGRKTAAIVADVVGQSVNRQGVVFFAATIKHAEEILASLPPQLSGIVHGATKDRDAVLKAFAQKKIKYIVNVGVLTTGWDCSHVDVVAMLRRTESVGLMQQCIGRGLRIDPDKSDCLVLDYADNITTHAPDGDLFAPIIKAGKASGSSVPIDAECPDCHHVNEFGLQPDYADYQRDQFGYVLDVFGQPLMNDHGQIPAHYGRRCFGVVPIGKGKYDRCNYRWNGKPCPSCEEPNDIAARYCYVCKAEIVNPNDKLIADFKAMKRDPTQPQTDKIISIATSEGESARGNKTLRVDFVTSYRQFSIWLMPEAENARAINDWNRWERVGGDPKTVSYVKDVDSSFYRVLAYNQPADDEDLPPEAGDDKQIKRMKVEPKSAAKKVVTFAKKAEKEERFNVMKDIFSREGV